MATNFQRTPGEMECHLAPRSGLRRRDFNIHCASNQTQNVNGLAVGGASGATVSSWTALTLASQANQFCGTLVALIAQSTPAANKTIQLRVRGYDQFGQYIQEITPLVTCANKTNTYIYLAKCFAQVVSIAFKSTGLTTATDTISIGTRWDWTRTIDASNDHQFGRNLGIAVPMRLGRRGTGSTFTRYRQQPNVGMGGEWIKNGAFNTNSLLPQLLRADLRGYAKGFLSLSGLPIANETVTIDGLTYTWKASVTTTAREVLIGADAATSAVNLCQAINAQPGATTLFGTATTAHPTVKAETFTNAYGSYVCLIARYPGAIYNAVALAETMTNGVLASSTMQGGYDDPIEIIGLTVTDFTGYASSGWLTQHTPQDILVGYQQSGWDCPVEKIHFITGPAQWAVTDNIIVRMTVLTAEAATQ